MSSRFNMGEGAQKMASEKGWKDRPAVTDLLSDSTDRKITRNQKRRHDEINHIQKRYKNKILPSYMLLSFLQLR